MFPFTKLKDAFRKTRSMNKRIACVQYELLNYFEKGDVVPLTRLAAQCNIRDYYVSVALSGLAYRGLFRRVSGCRYERSSLPFTDELREELLATINAPSIDDRLEFNYRYCRSLIANAASTKEVVDIIAERIKRYYRGDEPIPIFVLASRLNRHVETIYEAVEQLAMDGFVVQKGDSYFRTSKETYNETPLCWE